MTHYLPTPGAPACGVGPEPFGGVQTFTLDPGAVTCSACRRAAHLPPRTRRVVCSECGAAVVVEAVGRPRATCSTACASARHARLKREARAVAPRGMWIRVVERAA